MQKQDAKRGKTCTSEITEGPRCLLSQSLIVIMQNESKCVFSCKVKVVSAFIGSKMLCLLDAPKVDDALALVTGLSDNLEDRTLEVTVHALVFVLFAGTPVRKKGLARAFMCASEMLNSLLLK